MNREREREQFLYPIVADRPWLQVQLHLSQRMSWTSLVSYVTRGSITGGWCMSYGILRWCRIFAFTAFVLKLLGICVISRLEPEWHGFFQSTKHRAESGFWIVCKGLLKHIPGWSRPDVSEEQIRMVFARLRLRSSLIWNFRTGGCLSQGRHEPIILSCC